MPIFLKALVCLVVMGPLFAEESFFLFDGVTNKTVTEMGDVNNRISPCSTFKIALSLMGYDAGILKDTTTPVWYFKEGYEDYLSAWKTPQTPQSWMNYSCVWYSKVLTMKLGLEEVQNYLALFAYGNQDFTALVEPGYNKPAWIRSSLTISPKEEAIFVQKMVQGLLPVSEHAMQMTKALLFKEDLLNGWKLFGKTGWSGSMDHDVEYAWFVGWIEKENSFFPFAYLIHDKKINLDQRVPRVKQLLTEANIMK